MTLPPPLFVLDIRPGEPTLAVAAGLLLVGYLLGRSSSEVRREPI